MQPIKTFLYLDEYRMYSISSQIFGGLTEYLIDYEAATTEENETQRAPFGSGRVMADILKSESGTQEKKYLHDYSYTLFEQHLREQEKVTSVSEHNNIDRLEEVSFIEVRAQAVFNDMSIIKATLNGFNSLGEALAYVTSFSELQDLRQRLDELGDSTGDRNERARLRQRRKALENPTTLAEAKGLQQDPKLLDNLEFILDYGFKDQFEVKMVSGEHTFSADLKREYLREREDLLIRKYSRFSEKTFVLLGTIAQSASDAATNDVQDGNVDDAEPGHVREAVMGMVEALFNMEQTLSGKLPNEIIVDPIALYCEI